MTLGRNFKIFLAVTGVVVALGFTWLMTDSPLSWGFRPARNSSECRAVSLQDYSDDQHNLYCRYKGKSFFYRHLDSSFDSPPH